MTTVNIRGVEVPCTTETPSINVNDIVTKFVPWKEWVDSLDDNMRIEHVHFQSVDASRDHILFVKMKCTAFVGKEKKHIPGVILLRGSSVGCLIEVECEGKTYALLIEQPRLASGKSNFREVVAGMMDGSNNFTGGMVREVKVYSIYHNLNYFVYIIYFLGRNWPGY